MDKIKERYLDLVKKTLSFTLWPEPPLPVEIYDPNRKFISKLFVKVLSSLLKPFKLQLVKNRNVSDREREEGLFWPRYADTMVGLKRLDNIQFCVQTVLVENIEGDLIETGVWRGGSCIFMRAILAAFGVNNRKIFVADSFEGLPPPDIEKYPADKGDIHYKQRLLAVTKEEVENNFRKYDLLDEQVVFLKGWFKDTLPKVPIEKLSVIRLDGDMYSSTMEALDNLYPKLSAGGFCIIDDYGLVGCKKAVDDYRERNHITREIVRVDWTGVYWRKP